MVPLAFIYDGKKKPSLNSWRSCGHCQGWDQHGDDDNDDDDDDDENNSKTFVE